MPMYDVVFHINTEDKEGKASFIVKTILIVDSYGMISEAASLSLNLGPENYKCNMMYKEIHKGYEECSNVQFIKDHAEKIAEKAYAFETRWKDKPIEKE